MRNQREFKFGLYLWRERSIERKITKILYHFICHKFPQKHSEGKTTDHNQSYSRVHCCWPKAYDKFLQDEFRSGGGGGGGGGAEVSCPNIIFSFYENQVVLPQYNLVFTLLGNGYLKTSRGLQWAVYTFTCMLLTNIKQLRSYRISTKILTNQCTMSMPRPARENFSARPCCIISPCPQITKHLQFFYINFMQSFEQSWAK